MKIKIFFPIILLIINIGSSKASQAPTTQTPKNSIGDILKASLSWTISVSSSPFKKPTLQVSSKNNSEEASQAFPLVSQDEAKEITTSLSESFRGLPSGYQDCLCSILIGQNESEHLSLTPETITIQDREQRSLRFTEKRK